MSMTLFVESIKRLYTDGMVDKEKIEDLHKNGKLNEEEVNYILDVR